MGIETLLELPVTAWINQSFLVTLEGQDCSISLYQRGASMYLDLSVNGEIITQGALCQPGVGIIQNATTLFFGQLFIIDSLSAPLRQESPVWKGLGTRWLLIWLAESELAEIGLSLEELGNV